MSSPRRRPVVALAVLAACGLAARSPGQGLALDVVERIHDLTRPVELVDPGDGSGRWFVVQQTGEILVWNGSSVETTPFLDLSSAVVCCNERGLLGLAFSPDFADDGRFYVDYTRDLGGGLQTVLSRFAVSAGDPDVADAASEQVLLVLDQPAANHNGGHLAFGPDGRLYVATGDGGGGGDPEENGQDPGSLLGKLLRLDVDGPPDAGLAYAVPPDNPFVGVAGARGEVWAYGLRNPWRFSFDRATGDLWIGDVGQGAWEEVDVQAAGDPGGENYGWDCREGAHDYADPNGDHNATCAGTGYTEPVLEYAHGAGRCSITGGFRYRGAAEPRLRGVYLYADYCTGEIFGTVPRCDGAWESRLLLDAPFAVSTFGETDAGDLLVSDYRGDGSATSRLLELFLAPGSGGPDLQAAPAALDFGTVEVGDSVTRPFTLTNTNAGPEATVVATGLLTDPARFVLGPGAGSPSCDLGGTPCLPPGASCGLAITFRGDAPGAVSAALTFDGNFAAETVTLGADVVPCASAVDLTVTGVTVGDGESETRRACDTLTAGPDVSVESGGALTLRAGTRIALGEGFRVAAGDGSSSRSSSPRTPPPHAAGAWRAAPPGQAGSSFCNVSACGLVAWPLRMSWAVTPWW